MTNGDYYSINVLLLENTDNDILLQVKITRQLRKVKSAEAGDYSEETDGGKT